MPELGSGAPERISMSDAAGSSLSVCISPFAIALSFLSIVVVPMFLLPALVICSIVICLVFSRLCNLFVSLFIFVPLMFFAAYHTTPPFKDLGIAARNQDFFYNFV